MKKKIRKAKPIPSKQGMLKPGQKLQVEVRMKLAKHLQPAKGK